MPDMPAHAPKYASRYAASACAPTARACTPGYLKLVVRRTDRQRQELTCFAKALRLVVLKQTSSATIERIFSQLTYIQRICGLATTSETLKLRLLIRCNEGCMDDFDG